MSKDMKEYTLSVNRTYTQEVTDVYTIVADNREEAKMKAKELLKDPVNMAMTPHDTYEDKDNKVWNEEFTTNLKGDSIDVNYDNYDLLLS